MMGWEFAGFFIEDSKIINKKIFSHKVQELEGLKKVYPCLLLLTDELSKDTVFNNNLGKMNTLELLDYYKY
ncbi:MAG: hypothetical protein SCARUB_00271 [Candidatus Scalindua rubra]|uniref:Uncharacterized protein n=1 Tax=Candidatus Scalindua rubra TaxID=1872076 RepID=A0A1E3XFV8_9BACT|nr:MAG: hypothetical protein SCARUB_00271 [Candidatus Scalindua rubra]